MYSSVRLFSLTRDKSSQLVGHSFRTAVKTTTTTLQSSSYFSTQLTNNNNKSTLLSFKVSQQYHQQQQNHRSIIPSCFQYNNTNQDENNNQRRYYTPMTADEEENEKHRVSLLTPNDKEQELRKLNRDIAKLEMLRGINTGQQYTWTGRYKKLASEYGVPLTIYYGVCWFTTACLIYSSITIFDIDVMLYVAKIDTYFGWTLASKIDPQLGTIGAAVVINELIEPIRLPFIIVTVKPLVDTFFPDHTKY